MSNQFKIEHDTYLKANITRLEQMLKLSENNINSEKARHLAARGFAGDAESMLRMHNTTCQQLEEYYYSGFNKKKDILELLSNEINSIYAKELAKHGLIGQKKEMLKIMKEIPNIEAFKDYVREISVILEEGKKIDDLELLKKNAEKYKVIGVYNRDYLDTLARENINTLLKIKDDLTDKHAWQIDAKIVVYYANYLQGAWIQNKEVAEKYLSAIIAEPDDLVLYPEKRRIYTDIIVKRDNSNIEEYTINKMMEAHDFIIRYGSKRFEKKYLLSKNSANIKRAAKLKFDATTGDTDYRIYARELMNELFTQA